MYTTKKYIIIEKTTTGKMTVFKVKYIYYGHIASSHLSESKSLKQKSDLSKYTERIFNDMEKISMDKLKLKRTGIREIVCDKKRKGQRRK